MQYAMYKIMNNNLDKNTSYGIFSWQYTVIVTVSSDQQLSSFFSNRQNFFPRNPFETIENPHRYSIVDNAYGVFLWA